MKKRFDQFTRKKLEAAFRKAYMLKFSRPYPKLKPDPADHATRVFVNCLEGLVNSPIPVSKRKLQQRRREQVEALANALDRFIQTALAMDDASLSYALWRGLDEMVEQENFSDEDRVEVRGWMGLAGYRQLVYELKTFRAQDPRQFALGVRKAIKELPELDQDSFAESTARWLENYLGRQSIPFSTSDTGLAGMAFLAVMELAGSPQDGASYWLMKTKKNPGSFLNWIKGLGDRT